MPCDISNNQNSRKATKMDSCPSRRLIHIIVDSVSSKKRKFLLQKSASLAVLRCQKQVQEHMRCHELTRSCLSCALPKALGPPEQDITCASRERDDFPVNIPATVGPRAATDVI